MQLPSLNADNVILISNNYLDYNGIDRKGYVITHISFDRKLKLWTLIYKSDSLIIGDGLFGVSVSDEAPSNVFYQ